MVAAHEQPEARPAVVAALDGPAVRRWARAGLAALVAARDEIDDLNVYPIPDADTGTNLVRTLGSAVGALAGEPGQDLQAVCECLAGAALRGACGNSGTILAQLLRGLADATSGQPALGPRDLALALSEAAVSARTAIVHPVEGTMLSVADAAASGALSAADRGGDLAAVTRAGSGAATAALAATPGQLAALGGRVDAGGRGLQLLVEALATVVAGEEPVDDSAAQAGVGHVDAPASGPRRDGVPDRADDGVTSPSHEVMYLLDTIDDSGQAERVAELRAALDRLGDSVLVVGGRGLWQVHAHVDDVGAAVEVGFAAGRPHQVRIVAFADASTPPRAASSGGIAVVATADGPGLVALLARAGAQVLADPLDLRALAGLVATRTGPVAILPGSVEALGRAEQFAAGRPAVRVVRSRSAVQVIAALAVHDPAHDPDADLLAMATAAAGCRTGLVEMAEGEGVTSAGVCRPGDILGHVDGDVALIGSDVEQVAAGVLDRLLGGGGELVTLVVGQLAAGDLATRVATALRGSRPDVDVTIYDGGQPSSYLLVGIE